MNKVTKLVALILLLSCVEKKTASTQELMNYVLNEDNGLYRKAEKNDVLIEVVYRPVDLILQQELEEVKEGGERQRMAQKYDHLTYFIIKFSKHEKEIESAYMADDTKFIRVINYLSGPIASDIYIRHNGDTIRALDAVYSRMFGATNATSVMLVFGGGLRSKKGKFIFCFDDTELGLGKNEFQFDLTDIRKTPTLNLN
jgi:hypothetical protein